VSDKKKQPEAKNAEAVMGVVDHIREFRNRLIIIVVVFVAAFFICFNFAAPLVDILRVPSADLYEFIYISPSELLLQYIKVSLIAALVVAAPVLLYELLAFAGPGLMPNEKKFVAAVLVLGTLFFILGVLFSYTILLPFMLRFFSSINNNTGITPQISIEKYLGLVLSILSTLGLVFEMPVLTILMTQLGLLRPEWLKKSRRVVIVIIFVVAALITPPDVVSQVMVAIPMLALFEISIAFSTLIRRRKLKKRAEEEEKYKYQ